jgi:hypothetical protein
MCVSSRPRSIRSHVNSTAGIAILLPLLVFSAVRSGASVANQFYNTPTYSTGGTPAALATGDFNRDGKTDVVVLNGNGVVSFMQGDGRGGFAAPKTIATLLGVASNPTLLAADFNGDGNLDLLILQDPGTSFSIYSGRGDGSFADPVTVNDGLPAAGNVAIGDFNGDGRSDIAITGVSSIAVIFANPSGGFEAPIILSTPYNVGTYLPIALGDLNQDGHLDVLVTNENGEFQSFLGDGRGQFNPQTANIGSYVATSMAIADFNHDGKPDIALAKPTFFYEFDVGAVTIVYGNGDGTFTPSAQGFFQAPDAFTSVQLADFNGRSGLVFPTDPVYVVTSDATGQLSEASYAAGGGPVGVGDFNGDGMPDVVAANLSGIQVLANAGSGVLRAPIHQKLMNFPFTNVATIDVADLNGDGVPDLAVIQQFDEHGYFSFSVGSMLGSTKGGLTSVPTGGLGDTFAVNTHVSTPAIGDFNHDGHLDVAYAGYYQSGPFPQQLISLAAGDGKGNFSTLGQNIAMNSESLAGGYYNADGNADLASVDGVDLQVLIGNGDGTFKSPVKYDAGSNPVFVMQRDLNADGKKDLVVVNEGSDDISVLLGNGDGTFRPQKRFPAGLHPVWAVTGDFNRDGKTDIAVASTSGVSILLGNGDGTFRPEHSFPANGALTVIAQASLRQDGIECIVGIDSVSRDFVVLPGMGDGTFAAPVVYPTDRVPLTLAVGDFNADGAPDVVFAGTNLNSPSFDNSAQGVVLFYNQGGDSVTLSSNHTALKPNQSVTLSVKVKPSFGGLGTPTGRVYFKDNDKFFAGESLSNGAATLTTTFAAGTHRITAYYTGDSVFNTNYSSTISIPVGP